LSNRGLLPIKDGHTRRSYNILKGLAEQNQVYFLSLYETPEEIEQNNVNELKSFCSHVEFHHAPLKKLSIPMLLRLTRSLFSMDAYTIWRHYSRSFLKRVDELISTGEFDLVHCDTLPLAYTVRARSDIFRSITDHDVSYLKCLRMGEECKNILLKMFMILESIKLKKLESDIFKHVNLGIAVSDLDKNLFQELCPEGKFTVIENGVDIAFFKPINKDVLKNKLVWVGGFEHYSNKQGMYYFMDNIYPTIKKLIPEIELDVIGGGVTEKLMNMANNDKSINLLGFVDNTLPYIHRAAVFIVPILSGGGTRLKVIEAMSAGKAIVSTRVGCEGIAGKDGKHFIIADSPTDFANAVLKIVLDDNLRNQLGDCARELVKTKYDWHIIIDKLCKIYQEVNEK
jgi:glycosyltransferase involved in cell wall biosynthesis